MDMENDSKVKRERKQKMISIIIPVYNAEKYLSFCIESILNQTYTEFELILVDDGSSDCSAGICDLYADKDSRIKAIHDKNHGVSHARNIGLRLAKGSFIAFCDADDMYKSDYLMQMRNTILNSKADIVICNYSYLRDTKEKVIGKRKSGVIDKDELYRRIFIDNTIGGFVWNKFFRKSLLTEMDFNENMQVCEDTYFLCKTLNRTSNIYYLENSLYLYRLHENSVMAGAKNMFDNFGNLKYALVYEKMLSENIIAQEYAHYVKANLCVLAIGAKCDYLNDYRRIDKNKISKTRNYKNRVDKNIVQKTNKIIRCNFIFMITCQDYSLKKKLVCIGNTFFNLRKYK